MTRTKNQQTAEQYNYNMRRIKVLRCVYKKHQTLLYSQISLAESLRGLVNRKYLLYLFVNVFLQWLCFRRPCDHYYEDILDPARLGLIKLIFLNFGENAFPAPVSLISLSQLRGNGIHCCFWPPPLWSSSPVQTFSDLLHNKKYRCKYKYKGKFN